MKLYEILNGYMGESYVRCLVIAEDEETAIETARVEYKKIWAESQTNLKCGDYVTKYNENYYTELKAYLLCDDVSKGYTSKVNDGYTIDV